MNVNEALQAVNAWLGEHGVAADEAPAPATPQALAALGGLGEVTADLSDFYSVQNGLPHWFILYRTWQFLTLENALEVRQSLLRSTSHLPLEGRWQHSWLPVLTNNGGDYVFVDLGGGAVEFYSHLDGSRSPVSDGLPDLLGTLVNDLEDYRFVDEEPEYQGGRAIGFS